MNQNNYDKQLRNRFRFFFANAGYCVGRRAEGALALARAELKLEQAKEAGKVRVRWEEDSCPDLSWLDLPENEGVTVSEVLGCLVEMRCECCGNWVPMDSLWGICDPDRDYSRVIEAELACESLKNWEVAA